MEHEDIISKIDGAVLVKAPPTYGIVGQDEAKECLTDILDVMLVDDIDQQMVLLEGPTGTGKSTIIENIIKEYQKKYPNVYAYKKPVDAATFSNGIHSAERINEYFDDVEKKQAKKIIFIDEIEEICMTRKECQHVRYERTAALIRNFNREIPNLVIFAATNRPKKIDKVILDRFQSRINCAMPDEREMREIIELHLGEYLGDHEISVLHDCIKHSQYKYWNGRDIANIRKKLKLQIQLNGIKKIDIPKEAIILKLFMTADMGKKNLKADYLDDDEE